MAIDPTTLTVDQLFIDQNNRVWRVTQAIKEDCVEVEAVGNEARKHFAGVTDLRWANFTLLVPTP